MKRDMPSTSKDSLKQPQPTKKQSTLDLFIKVQKLFKQQTPSQNQSVKLQPFINSQQQSTQKSNSNSNPRKSLTQPFDLSDPAPYILRPLSRQQQDQIASTYLNVHFTYACEQCHKDITNYTKIKMDDKIYCVQCAGDSVDKNYTVVKALYDESLKEFPEQKEKYDEPVWSFKDELRLIEALQLYGIDSYELIQDHMKTEHKIQDIKAHIEFFVNKFAHQLKQQSRQARNLFTVDVDLYDFEKPEKIEKVDKSQQEIPLKKKESISSKDQHKKQKSPRNKAYIMQKFNERVRNLLKIYSWNSQTDKLKYEFEPTLFTLLASQITKEDIHKHPDVMEIINQRRKYEIIEKQIIDKALKAIIMQQNNDTSIQSSDQQGIESQRLTDPQNYKNKKQAFQNRYLTQDEKWTLFKCQTIKKYNILRPDQSKKLQRYVRRTKLMYKLNEIEKKGDYEMVKMRNKYCKENALDEMSVEEFAQGLSEEVLRRIFNQDEAQKIYKQLEILNWMAQKEKKTK